MFFIVRSFLIPFGAPRRVGAPVPTQMRRLLSAPPWALSNTPRHTPPLLYPVSLGLDLPPQPHFLNHHPLAPALALATVTSHLEMAPGLLTSLLPSPTCAKGIFPKHKSDRVLSCTAFRGALSPSVWLTCPP